MTQQKLNLTLPQSPAFAQAKERFGRLLTSTYRWQTRSWKVHHFKKLIARKNSFSRAYKTSTECQQVFSRCIHSVQSVQRYRSKSAKSWLKPVACNIFDQHAAVCERKLNKALCSLSAWKNSLLFCFLFFFNPQDGL